MNMVDFDSSYRIAQREYDGQEDTRLEYIDLSELEADELDTFDNDDESFLNEPDWDSENENW
jgi:hypothetical protein